MQKLITPQKLKKGDKIATISLSWGGAGDGDILWRYHAGKKRLEDVFGLHVVEMPNTLMGTKYLYEHPEKRAEDLMNAFSDASIKGIFSCIGGDDSIRLLPYIDFDVISSNPKIFLGYSDTTISHFFCLKAGLSSFYGPSVLAEFAENVDMHEYTKTAVEKVLFSSEPIGEIFFSDIWTSQRLPWEIKNKDIVRKMQHNSGYELLQGRNKVRGRLIGGCIEVLEMMKNTALWPDRDSWEDVILFLETSEEMPEPLYIRYWLRNYAAQGILHKIKGIIWGKPYNMRYYDEYKEVIHEIIAEECELRNLPILYNMNFGHTAPMMILPYGALAEIDCEHVRFSILE